MWKTESLPLIAILVRLVDVIFNCDFYRRLLYSFFSAQLYRRPSDKPRTDTAQ